MLERSEEQFPELPMQWRDHGYEIDQRLGVWRRLPTGEKQRGGE